MWWPSGHWSQCLSWDTNPWHNLPVPRDSDLHLWHWISDLQWSPHSNGYLYGWQDLGTSTNLSTCVKLLPNWINIDFTHSVVDCGSPPPGINAYPRTLTSTTYRGTVLYTCDTGYEISNGVTTAMATCVASGMWETVPTCTSTVQGFF